MLKHCGTKLIETEQLILRPFEYNDNDDMLKYWISDPKVQYMYSEPVYTTKLEVKSILDNYIESYEKNDYYRWAIIEKSSQICIGQISIYLVNTKNHFGELEYCIGRLFQRKGYMTEATNAVIAFGFNNINFHKIQICHCESNLSSKGVIKKCGFTYEATIRDYYYVNGKYQNRLYYSILEEEWFLNKNAV